MCYNCGCKMPDDDHGNPKNITNKTFKEAAEAEGQKDEEVKRNTAELLGEQMKQEAQSSTDQSI